MNNKAKLRELTPAEAGLIAGGWHAEAGHQDHHRRRIDARIPIGYEPEPLRPGPRLPLAFEL